MNDFNRWWHFLPISQLENVTYTYTSVLYVPSGAEIKIFLFIIYNMGPKFDQSSIGGHRHLEN
jgi:hypothetical protein